MSTKLPHSKGFGETVFDKEGHRGCRGLMPENTIPAMLKAIDLGVTTLEMDASISKDGQVFLSHEPFFNHEITTKPDGSFIEESVEKNFNMYQMNFTEIQKYDVGLKPHPRFPNQLKLATHKPLLANLFDTVQSYCLQKHLAIPQFNIETKTNSKTDGLYHPGPNEFVDLLVAVIQSKKMEDKVIIQSFDIRTLQYLHLKYPNFKTALLIEDFDKKPFALQLKDLGFLPTIYSPAHILVTDLLVKQCRDAGIQIIPWTVNDLPRMQELKKMGVHGIISDYPNLFAGLK
ncbi:MAG: glycerophosphodiester phosphodiesterase family protein [Bacteroidetes bacterium]|nr:glycerophosphodiester phosphodiesterase family protein [Bacteroidota bacterium]